jgi:hypothetical protein
MLIQRAVMFNSKNQIQTTCKKKKPKEKLNQTFMSSPQSPPASDATLPSSTGAAPDDGHPQAGGAVTATDNMHPLSASLAAHSDSESDEGCESTSDPADESPSSPESMHDVDSFAASFATLLEHSPPSAHPSPSIPLSPSPDTPASSFKRVVECLSIIQQAFASAESAAAAGARGFPKDAAKRAGPDLPPPPIPSPPSSRSLPPPPTLSSLPPASSLSHFPPSHSPRNRRRSPSHPNRPPHTPQRPRVALTQQPYRPLRRRRRHRARAQLHRRPGAPAFMFSAALNITLFLPTFKFPTLASSPPFLHINPSSTPSAPSCICIPPHDHPPPPPLSPIPTPPLPHRCVSLLHPPRPFLRPQSRPPAQIVLLCREFAHAVFRSFLWGA